MEGKIFLNGKQISSIIRKNIGSGFRTTADEKVFCYLMSLKNEKDKMQ